jgi:ABC-type uncharacterized transport system permease subunit
VRQIDQVQSWYLLQIVTFIINIIKLFFHMTYAVNQICYWSRSRKKMGKINQISINEKQWGLIFP